MLAAVAGHVLLGHGLAADLAALGLAHPGEACQDTRDLTCFQSTHGSACALGRLARTQLGRPIQQGHHSARHAWVRARRCKTGHLGKPATTQPHSCGGRHQQTNPVRREDATAVMELFLAVADTAVGCKPQALLAFELHRLEQGRHPS